MSSSPLRTADVTYELSPSDHGKEKPSEDLVEKVFDKVYANFVEEIDANDNGVDTHDGEPRYQVVHYCKQITAWP